MAPPKNNNPGGALSPAGVAGNSGVINPATPPPPIGVTFKVTHDKEIRLHEIREDQLDALERPARDVWYEVFWAVGGVFLGSVYPAIERVVQLTSKPSVMAWYDIALVTVPVVTLFLAIVSLAIFVRRRFKVGTLAKIIRARPTRTIKL